MKKNLLFYIKNLTIKQKVIVGIVVVFVIGVLISNIVIFAQLVTQVEEMIVEQSRSICTMGEAMREYTADNWERGVYDRNILTKDIKGKFVYTVPVFAAIKTMEKKAAEMGYDFKVPKISPRNPKNKPDEFETRVLKKLADENSNEYVFVDWEEGKIHYFRSVRLTKECLACHGDPATSSALWNRTDGTDPTGAVMENWKEGEIHGAFELIYDIDKIVAAQSRVRWEDILINLVIIIGAVLIIRRIVKKALSPLDTMSDSLVKLNEGAGDLTQQIPVRSDDEVGKVAVLFNSFLEQMRKMMMSVSDSSTHVATSSEEMTATSQSLANVAQEQAASIEETSSAMEEIKATIDSVSANAKDQAKKADTTRSSMEYLARAINDINHNAQEANQMAEETHSYAQDGEGVLVQTVDSMKEISESSNKITEIVTIISDISDQINLLSLNASIEAARAGDHGKGFAVVAEEISKLADQTAQSSKEINKLINETNTKVNSGAALVESTAASLRKIIDNVKATAGIMENIAKSSVDLTNMSNTVTDEVLLVNRMSEEISIMMEEQSVSSNEIIKAIDQINNITQSVASGSEELAAGSEELSSQSEVLNDIVQRFKLS